MSDRSHLRGFRYVERDGVVKQIRGTNTSSFLRIDPLPTASDRTLTPEALETLGRARTWAEGLSKREKEGK